MDNDSLTILKYYRNEKDQLIAVLLDIPEGCCVVPLSGPFNMERLGPHKDDVSADAMVSFLYGDQVYSTEEISEGTELSARVRLRISTKVKMGIFNF